jgi:saccharopine dehydrogenase-like NADP-dependent oxidoreductase
VVTSFSSVCGGLPAPEAANNPLGYKFSWSPRGVLGATRNDARFRRDGCEVVVPGESLLVSAAPFRVNPAFALEVIPNRDALPYADKYGIAGPRLRGMFRGTLRYAGFCADMHAVSALGMLALEPAAVPAGISLRGWLAALAGAKEEQADDDIMAAVYARVAAIAASDVKTHVDRLAALSPVLGSLAAAGAAVSSNAALATDLLRQRQLRAFFEWAGLLSSATPAPLRGSEAGDGGITTAAKAVPAGEPITHVPIDTMVALLTSKPEMSFAPGERDMALMVHEVEVELPDGGRELHTSSLIEYGIPGKKQTAMSRTVGLTAAIGAQLILDGRAHAVGVQAPTTREWYGPMLQALEEEGVAMKESCRKL